MKKSNRAYYDEFADWYEKGRDRGYHAMIDDLEVDLLHRYVKGKEVLEVGCGTGLVMHRVAERARSVAGIDISAGMLRQARRRGLNVAQADATALPFGDAEFDIVYSLKVLAHVRDIDRALQEMARVTRPGGTLLLEFYNPMSLRYLAKRVAGPGKISRETDESAVYTRWDDALDLTRRLPEQLELVDYAGVRIFTPAAFLHRVPIVGRALRRLEFMGRDSVLKYFGGFLVAIIERA
ncbi:MAG: class I SAM-dependent methyltransferase [Myxococcota bacterium]